MFITDVPAIHPYMCSICLCTQDSPEREWFIDTGIDTSYDGRVYICNKCTDDLIRVAPTAFSIDQVTEMFDANQDTVNKAEELIKMYESRIAILQEMGFDLSKAMAFIERSDKDERFRLTARTDDIESDDTKSESDSSVAESADVESGTSGTNFQFDEPGPNFNPLFPIDFGISAGIE